MKTRLHLCIVLLLVITLLSGCGKDGKSAYEIALDHGFVGTEEQWLASLHGDNGANGLGGEAGKDGANGKSAYELAVEYGYSGTQEEFLQLLLGRTPGFAEGDQEVDSETGSYVPVPGKSAYEIAVDHGYIGTEEEWLASLSSGVSEELSAAAHGVLPGKVDMAAMNALLALASEQNRTIRFADGVYIFPSTIHVLSNTSLLGCTNTVFSLSSTSTDSTLMSIGSGVDNVYLAHLLLTGGETARPAVKGSRIGLNVSGALRVNIENVEISGFDLYGFYGSHMSSTNLGDFYKMLQITNCRFYHNYYGMCLGQRCEYTQVLNCVFGENQVGCLNQGGNNMYTGCIFNVNGTGFQMDSKNLSNPAHGGCTGCAFNHNDKALVVNDCQIGWIFNGCQIFYGSLELNECQGVIFSDCIFGSCTLRSTHATLSRANMICNSYFQTASSAILAGNDGSTYIYNCLPDHLNEEDVTADASEESAWVQLGYTQKATSASAASENAYFGVISCSIPADTHISILDIIAANATAPGQSVDGVDVWVCNAETGEVIEQLVTDTTLYTVYSPRLKSHVLRIYVDRTYDYPIFFALEATRTSGRGIAYGRTSSNANFFSGQAVAIGDILTVNSNYIPEIAVYSIPEKPE